MICMETIGKIRRRHLVGNESISAVARSLNLSRNTVKKYLKTTEAPPYQRRHSHQPRFGALMQTLYAWFEHAGARRKWVSGSSGDTLSGLLRRSI
ncbi:helix-turn-helix domain-containing protein [Chromobacterium violaceum]